MNFTKKQDKHLIFGYLGYGNWGDEALAKALADHILKNKVNAKVDTLSKKDNLLQHLAKLSDASQIYLIGGMFQDRSSFASILYYAFVTLWAKSLGLQVIACCQSIGPLHSKLARNITSYCYRQIDIVSVRDQSSFDFLQEHGIKAELGDDLLWSFKDNLWSSNLALAEDLAEAKFETANEESVWFCIRDGYSKFYEDIKAKFLAELKAGKKISFLLMQDIDTQAVENFLKRLFEEKTEELPLEGLDFNLLETYGVGVFELAYLMNKYCTKLYTMRLHGMILAQMTETELELVCDYPKLVQQL